MAAGARTRAARKRYVSQTASRVPDWPASIVPRIEFGASLGGTAAKINRTESLLLKPAPRSGGAFVHEILKNVTENTVRPPAVFLVNITESLHRLHVGHDTPPSWQLQGTRVRADILNRLCEVPISACHPGFAVLRLLLRKTNALIMHAIDEAPSRWAEYFPCFGALQKSRRGPHSHNLSRQQGAAAGPCPKVPLTTLEAWHVVYEPCCCSRAFLASHKSFVHAPSIPLLQARTQKQNSFAGAIEKVACLD